MVREIVINIYLMIFKLLFTCCRLFPLKNKVTFASSFGDNSLFILNEMRKQGVAIAKVFVKTKNCKADIKGDGDTIVLKFDASTLYNIVRVAYHLATSKWILIDNYYAFLSVISFKPSVTCVQLWHAAGAIKKFGLQDPSVSSRNQMAKRRFKKVYSNFHYVLSGSEVMSNIFKESFDLRSSNILNTGIPRTDFFFNEDAKAESYHSLISKFPELKEKKIILYAPTYRDGELSSDKLALNLDMLCRELKHHGYVIILKTHPAVASSHYLDGKYSDFVYDLSGYPDINHLLLITDILISDYSSIPFEYSFLEKPMIFFAYDLEKYEQARGFWEDYVASMPGPVVFSTEDVVKEISNLNFDLTRIKQFKEKWNEYSNGQSSKNVIDFLFNQESGA